MGNMNRAVDGPESVQTVPAGARRRMITPEAFTVEPGLLGMPLARPWRRGVAMALDGILIALLSNSPGVGLAAAAAALLARAALRAWRSEKKYRTLRTASGLAGSGIVFVLVLVAWYAGPGMLEDAFTDAAQPPAAEEYDGIVTSSSAGWESVIQAFAVGTAMRGAISAMRTAESEAEAEAAARRLADGLAETGVPRMEIADALRNISGELDPLAAEAVNAVAAEYGRVAPSSTEASRLSRDSLAAVYASAVAGRDSARAAVVGHELGLVLAADSIAELAEEVRELEEENAELEATNEALEDDLAAANDAGIIAMLGSLVDDLGLGFGWAALYFTAFLVLGGGRTPGKGALRIQVLRLDGSKMTWWTGFERFGGYAAGLATGLLGYFQMFWDPNRQAVHDKIAGTVVVKTDTGNA